MCEIYIVLLQEAEGEGDGFAGGLVVALWHPWAGTASASSFLLSPCLHSCCSGTQPRASLHLSSPSSKKSLDFSLGSP